MSLSEKYNKITPEILEELKSIVGPDNIATDESAIEAYSCDESGKVYARMPDVVVKPENAQQVSNVMKLANREMIPVTARGAGSGIAGGAIPIKGGILLSLERMNRVLEIDKINRVAVVEPGVVTNDLCQMVLKEGLMYAGYPMSTETSFIGGNIATNAGGAKVIRYGSTRRHVLGIEVVLPTGDVLQLGGRIRKQTWGYDLLQTIIGSEGTLGVVTKAILNLEPAPGDTVTFLAPFPSIEAAVEAVAAILRAGVVLMACEFMDQLSTKCATKYHNTTFPMQDEAKAFLIIQVEGQTPEQLDMYIEKVGETCLEHGAMEVFTAESSTESRNIWKVRESFAEAVRAVDPNASLSGDMVVPMSKISEMVKAVGEAARKYDITIALGGHIADGNIHPLFFKPDRIPLEEWPDFVENIVDELIGVAISLGGVGSGEHGVGFLKKHTFMKYEAKSKLEVMRGIKKAFDPNGILNPGKLFD